MSISELQNPHLPQVYPGLVDAVVCINMSTRPDRKAKMLQSFPYKFYFYTATPHANPKTGCTQSHLDCIQWAKDNNFKNVMVVEDDVVVLKDLNTCTPVLPVSFDMLYLGGICLGIDGPWWQPWTKGKMVCMHAYIVNEKFYDTLISCIDYHNPPQILDAWLADQVHMKHECYILTDPLCIQEEDFSNIDNKVKWSAFKWPRAGEQCMIP